MAKLFSFLPSAKSSELRPVLLYTTANFLNKGISFLMLFYFTRVLTEADFGVLSLFSNAILLLTPLISLGLIQSATADYFRLEPSAFRDLMAGALRLPLLLAWLLFALGFLFRHSIAARFHFTPLLAAALPLIAWLVFLHELLTILMRNRHQPVHYFITGIGRLLIEIGFAVLLISGFGWGWGGRVTAVAISYCVVAGYAVRYFWQHNDLSGRLRPDMVRREIIFGGPVFLFQMGIFLLGSSGIWFIEHVTRNLADVGVYSVAVTFASVINVFCIAILQYAQPRLYALLANQRENGAAIRKLFLNYLAAHVGFTLLLLLVVPFVYLYLLKPSYRAGLAYYHWLCLGQFCWAIAYFFICWLLYHKLKKKIVLLSISAILLALGINAWLVRSNGNSGAAIASFIVYGAMLLLSLLLVWRPIRETARALPSSYQHD
jgi:O-antigen/teichoic acid export membrane protein